MTAVAHHDGVTIPAAVLELLRAPSPCFITTLMKDGSPQTTQTWVDTDGEHVVINTVEGYQKVTNVSRDPRVTVAVSDPENSFRYAEIRGEVIGMTTDGGADHIEELSQKYTGGPYQNYGGRAQTRVILTIRADKVNLMG
ncbi:MAG: F420-dependent protein [Humibacillus sp.]|nr:F420-dependent protein [Humibacillus sp.]